MRCLFEFVLRNFSRLKLIEETVYDFNFKGVIFFFLQ